MSSAERASPADRELTTRARLRTMLERRRRLWRRVLVFLLVTTAMVLAALLNRDTQQVRAKRTEAALIAEKLQEVYEHQRYLPLRFPDLPEPYTRLGQRYHFNILYASRGGWQRRVGVCCSREPVRLFLRADGRVVISFDGKRFDWEWMPEREFRAAAGDLGFDSTLLGK